MEMSKVGYARVSSYGQSLDVQLQKLSNDGCERIFSEKMSGRSAENRVELQNCLSWVREGDMLVVTKLDRLARSTRDLLNIGNELEKKKVSLLVLDQQIDTGSATGRLLFQLIGSISEFENEIRKDRQSQGVVLARSKGVKFGRKPAMSPGQVQELKRRRSSGDKITNLMAYYGLSKASVYRYLEDDVSV
jgi:DNA invertase Pin-like site-specific DNA recombinase